GVRLDISTSAAYRFWPRRGQRVSKKSTPEALKRVVRESQERIVRRLVWSARSAMMFSAVVVLGVAVFQGSGRSRVLLLVHCGLAAGFIFIALWKFRPIGWAPIKWRLLVTRGFVLLAMIFASGALESPLLPVLVANAIYLGILCPSPRAVRIATATQVALVWIFVGLQISGLVPPLFPQVVGAVGSASII